MTFDATQPTFGTFEDRAIWLIDLLLPDFPAWGYLDACAVAGNFGRESGIQMIQEGGQTPPNGGWGFAQWTGPRRRAFEAYCQRSGRHPSAMTTGYAYTFVELRGEFASVVGLVAKAPDLPSKVSAFEQHYEMAGVVAMSDRVAYATRAQAAWEARQPATGPSPVRPATAPVISPPPTTTPAPSTTPPPTKGPTIMGFDIATLLGVISSAPTIIGSGITLIEELNAGFQKAKTTPGANPLTYIEDMMAQLVANKGAVATAILGNEPKVAANGAPAK